MPLPEQRKNINSSFSEDLYSCGDMPRRPEATKGWLKTSHMHFLSFSRFSKICQDLVHHQICFAVSFIWRVSIPPLCLPTEKTEAGETVSDCSPIPCWHRWIRSAWS